MKVRHDKINELADSYICGNKSTVRNEVKRLNKAEFCFLVIQIEHRTDNIDLEQIVYSLLLQNL